MIRNLILMVVFGLSLQPAHAQLEVGSFAPDWTYTDINGQSHNLYNCLDSGYTVIMDISTTWCHPCWEYHETHVADSLVKHYGLTGTIDPQKIRFFLFEADTATDMTDLMGGGTSAGDWITGVNYPIIDTAAVMVDYMTSAYPTYYVICPNKHVIGKVAGYGTGMDLESYWTDFMDDCPAAVTGTDAAVIAVKPYLDLCDPGATIQNTGNATISAATVELYKNDTLVATAPFSGSLGSFDIGTVSFSGYDPGNATGMLKAKVIAAGDAVPGNDTMSLPYRQATLSSHALRIQVYTDQYAYQTKWKLMNGSTVLNDQSYGIGSTFQTFNYTYTVADVACLTFTASDEIGDGMTSYTPSQTDDGYIKFFDDSTGALLLTINGSDFTDGTFANIKRGVPTAIGGIDVDALVYLYPVPANDYLTIHLPADGAAAITVYDAAGKICYQAQADKSEWSISTKDLASGFYSVKVEMRSGVVVRRFSK